MPLFDTTVTLGNLLTLLSIIVGFVGIWMAAIRRLDRLEMRTELMWQHFAKRFNVPPKGDDNP